VIDIKNLVKDFAAHRVVNNVTASIQDNEVVAILGPSGSGKSTLLRCMNLLEKPTTGQIIIDGEDITQVGYNALYMHQHVGMVFQHFHLFPHMTVLENLVYAPCKVLKLDLQTAKARAESLLEKVGLADKADAYPARLSGGQKQRVAIARALAMEPKIMLFDEPTSALDPEMVKEVLDVIKGLVHTNMTIALVTHEMNFAREVADQIWFLDQGELLEQTPPSIFFSSPQSERASQFLAKVL
jgi:ABC-type polar amino acid transport system ATPase subunit